MKLLCDNTPNHLYYRLLDAVVADAISAVDADCAGKSKLLTAKRNGAHCGFRACLGKVPDELFELQSDPSRFVCEEAGMVYGKPNATMMLFAIAACERSVRWVCECVSAYLIFIGSRPIVATVRPEAVMKAYEIVQKLAPTKT